MIRSTGTACARWIPCVALIAAACVGCAGAGRVSGRTPEVDRRLARVEQPNCELLSEGDGTQDQSGYFGCDHATEPSGVAVSDVLMRLSGSDAQRRDALSQLATIGSSQLPDADATSVRDASGDRFVDEAMAPIVRAVVSHPDDIAAADSVVEVLARMRDVQTIPALRVAIRFHPERASERDAAARALHAIARLATMAAPSDLPELVADARWVLDRVPLTDTSPARDVRHGAIELVAALSPDTIADLLAPEISFDALRADPTAVEIALRALVSSRASIPAAVFVPALLFESNAGMMFARALQGLARVPATSAVTALLRVWDGIEPDASRVAAGAGAAQLLEGVHGRLAMALAPFAPVEAVERLLAAFDASSAEPYARVVMARALVRIVVAHPSVRALIVPALLHALTQPVPTDGNAQEGLVWIAGVIAALDGEDVFAAFDALSRHAQGTVRVVDELVAIARDLARVAAPGDRARVEVSWAHLRSIVRAGAPRDAEEREAVLSMLRDVDRDDPLLAMLRRCPTSDSRCLLGFVRDPDWRVAERAMRLLSSAPAPIRAEAREGVFACAPAHGATCAQHPPRVSEPALILALERLASDGCSDCVERVRAAIASASSPVPPGFLPPEPRADDIRRDAELTLLESRLRAASAPPGSPRDLRATARRANPGSIARQFACTRRRCPIATKEPHR